MVRGPDGVANNALHRRGTVVEAVLQVFDLLELNSKENGAILFQHTCMMGLEGIVSKRLKAPYRSGPARDWIKVKNPDSPAMRRARAGTW